MQTFNFSVRKQIKFILIGILTEKFIPFPVLYGYSLRFKIHRNSFTESNKNISWKVKTQKLRMNATAKTIDDKDMS